MKLNIPELATIEFLRNKGGACFVDDIDEDHVIDIWGSIAIPALKVFKKLEKKGLIFFSIPDPDEDEEEFRQEVYLEYDFYEKIAKYDSFK